RQHHSPLQHRPVLQHQGCQVSDLRGGHTPSGDRAAHRHHAAQRRRRPHARADADQPRRGQHAPARRARRGDRQVGHPHQPGRDQGRGAARHDPGGDGEADARRARSPRGDPHRRGRQAVADPHRRAGPAPVTPLVAEEIEAYSEAHTTPAPEHLQALAQETRASLECPQMLTGPVEGRLLETLVWISRPRLIVELGTYSGYSAQFMARALPPGGRLITCELSAERAEFARRRLDDPRVEIREGPALETLAAIDEPIDLAFIDADKPGYPDYYE